MIATDAETLTIREREAGQEPITVRRDEVDDLRPTPLSRMPEDLLNTLELEEILDLFSYVLAERR